MSDLLRAISRSSFVHNVQILPVASPVAGAEFVVSPRAGEDWRIIGIRATLTTSAAVANRVPELVWDDQTTIGAGVAAMTTQPASVAVTYNFAVMSSAFSTGALATGAKANVGLPELILPTGYRARSITSLIDVADQWSNISVGFERLDEPPWRNPMLGTVFDDQVEHELHSQNLGG